jgi:hypothetical protein
MISVHDILICNILSLIDEEEIDPSKVVSIDEIGLVQLESTEYPENIENMVGIRIPSSFFAEKEKMLNQLRTLGFIISPFQIGENRINFVGIEFKGTFIKACFFIHELQNTMIDLIGIDPYALPSI